MIERQYRFLLFFILAATAVFAWVRRFIVDDAFISFRYARNLAEGHGLVFNIGDRLEGYTNFLWTLLVTLPHTIDADPIQFCYLIGTVLVVLTVYLTYKLAYTIIRSKAIALLTALVVGTQPTFSAWATGGLETQLLACVLTATLWFSLGDTATDESAHGRYIVLSLLSAAALMTRLDSAIVVGIALTVTVLQITIPNGQPRMKMVNLLALVMPVTSLVGVWFWWKLAYYGELLPNTYYAKISEGSAWPSGLVYIWHFLNSYFLWPLLVILLLGTKTLIKRAPTRAAPLILAVTGYIAYVIHVGGDFMEFRMLVPVIPALYILLTWSLQCLVSSASLKACVIAVVMAGSVHHAINFNTVSGIESIDKLIQNLHDPASDWIGIGQVLKRDLNVPASVSIALTPVGAIPYYSELPTLDMLGLVDHWVARNGLPIFTQPGHRRLAPFSYIAGQGVNLLIGHPWVESTSGKIRESYSVRELWRMGYIADVTPIAFPATSRIVEIPLDSGRILIAVYLTKHASIDALISDGRWRAVRLANRT